MIARERHLRQLEALFRSSRVVAILGARQVGKTTLARQLVARHTQPTAWLDLEDPRTIARLSEPMLVLGSLRGLVVLDEIHRRPDLFPVLRVLADRPRSTTRFLVLGSASPALLRQTSESLAGRIRYHDLEGLALDEVGMAAAEKLWVRGGFPRAFLARTDRESDSWKRDLIRTYLERDLPDLGVTIPATTLRRFWTMLAHWHGQIWNSADFARSFGMADTTVRRYLDLLAGTFMVRALAPFHEDIAKRQVKSPKVYLTDSGVLHALLGLKTRQELDVYPRLGASWEGFALSQIIARLGARSEECFFWATHTGAELDLLVVRGTRRYGFEVKRTSTPSITPSMRSALTDLRLDRLDVVHVGSDTYPLGPRLRALPLSRLLHDLSPLG